MIGREKKKLLLKIDELLDGVDNKKAIDIIDNYVLGMISVSNFDGFGDDKQHDKDFESLCSILQRDTTQNIKKITTMEFYSLLVNAKQRSSKSGVKNRG